MRSACQKQRAAHLQTKRASYYVGWIDPGGKRRCKSFGTEEERNKLAQRERPKLEAHPVVIDHLRKIRCFDDYVFPWNWARRCLYPELERIHTAAGRPEAGCQPIAGILTDEAQRELVA